MEPFTPSEIVALRRSLGMSQERFARAVGVASVMTVSKWERGVSAPDRRSVAALRRLLRRSACPDGLSNIRKTS